MKLLTLWSRLRLAALALLLSLASFERASAQQLDSLLESIRRANDLPALAALVIRDGSVAATGAVGYRAYGDSTRVTLDDRFHLGSCTKAMTAAIVCGLIEEGKLSWKTTLADAFPELREKMRTEYRSVTLEHLLANRSGIPGETWPTGMTFQDVHGLAGSVRDQRRTYVELMLREEPAAMPGAEFVYSNAGFTVAAAMAERATDSSWEDLMKARLFRPLGMTTAGFGAMGRAGVLDQPRQHMRVEAVEHSTEPMAVHHPIEPEPMADNPPAIGPSGTVHCSIGDWGKFVAAVLRSARGEPGALHGVTAGRLTEAPFGGTYTLGWMLAERPWAGGTMMTHAGSNTMNFAITYLAPQKNFAVLVVTNEGGEIARAACDQVVGALIRQTLSRP